jgi:hypothetical protein
MVFEVVHSVSRRALLDPASYLVPPKSSTSRVRPQPLGYLQEKGYSALIEFAFIENALRRMTLMCDCAWAVWAAASDMRVQRFITVTSSSGS